MSYVSYLPPQVAPMRRAKAFTGQSWGAIAQVYPAVENTCDCSGDCTYNQCKVTRNDCDPGYYPVCGCGSYGCGCQCTPAG